MTAQVSGWVHRKRDHGNLLFIDLRDHHGLTQCVMETDTKPFAAVEAVRHESVLTVTGPVAARDAGTVNPRLQTWLREAAPWRNQVEAEGGVTSAFSSRAAIPNILGPRKFSVSHA